MASDSPDSQLPPQQRFILRLLERYGMPTVFALGIGAAWLYTGDRASKERARSHDALVQQLAQLAERVQEANELASRIEVMLLMRHGAKLEEVDPRELVQKRAGVAEIQKQFPVLPSPANSPPAFP
jgi:uncharacterized protein HemX